jgi:molybdopterin molybdotransferase
MGADMVEERRAVMLSIDQALEVILGHINWLEVEEKPLLECLGQTAAEDAVSDINVPDWDSASQDGYAVRSLDIRGAGPGQPRVLKVIDRAAAGATAQRSVIPGTAVRIMTGAPIPAGADCVVRFEDTDEGAAGRKASGSLKREIQIHIQVEAGANIRRAGIDVVSGAQVLQQGTVITPGDLGALAAIGRTTLKVIRRPQVVVIATGDELVNPGEKLDGPRIYNSNSVSLAARVKCCGGIPEISSIARDNKRSLTSKIRMGMKGDAIITCGGSSAGDRDLVKEVVSEMGKVLFWKVNMAPGKPFSFGLIEDTRFPDRNRTVPLFSLTGNPSAGTVNFEVLVRPAILKMQGRSDIYPETVEAVMLDSFENKKQARCFIWARVSRHGNVYTARISRDPEAGILPSIAKANALIIIPEEQVKADRGERVKVLILDRV